MENAWLVIFYISDVLVVQARGGRLLQTHTLIGQEVQLSSSDWTTATEFYLLSNQSTSL